MKRPQSQEEWVLERWEQTGLSESYPGVGAGLASQPPAFITC